MINKGFNVAGDPQYCLPSACNRLDADLVFITDVLQNDTAYCHQFRAEQVLWLTRSTDPRSIASRFKPNGKTKVNLWNEEEWWSKGTDHYFTPELAIPRLVQQLEWIDQVDASAIISVQIGVQWNAIGWAKNLNRDEWFAPIWNGLPQYAKGRIDAFNVHFYEPSGNTNLNPVIDFVTSIRSWMDRHGAGSKGIRIGEIGLDKAYYNDADALKRAESYPGRVFSRMENKNQTLGLGVDDIFFYCAGAYPKIDATSQYLSLVEFGKDALTNYGLSFGKTQPRKDR